jgi:hypothetical protein
MQTLEKPINADMNVKKWPYNLHLKMFLESGKVRGVIHRLITEKIHSYKNK